MLTRTLPGQAGNRLLPRGDAKLTTARWFCGGDACIAQVGPGSPAQAMTVPEDRGHSSSGGSTTGSSSMPSLAAISTAWVRLVTPSLRRIAVTCALMVASDTVRS